MRTPHAAIIAAVEQAIPFDGEITTRDLRAGLSIRLCTRTVCRALQVLVAEQRATFTGEMGSRRYRRFARNCEKGGPTERDPNRPYCKPDQSCCDFVCGN